ncbi:hypothetical protein KP509_30G064100 [Ceratopteris richardii]|uniref:N-acylneuraminate-9-phosphatase n=1 Tax=Ceratopteris richardii TaxID=49495 RepID=A0A8T2R364_CERRI|nr:hypothetical protein KP509_30G064100 [Ceratopteris richardii]
MECLSHNIFTSATLTLERFIPSLSFASQVQVRASATGMTMSVKAVFFDLDDTLVLTHAADKVAHRAVSRLLATRLPELDHQAVVDSFVLHFVSEPWDPHHQIDVTEWRSQLWNRALVCQKVEDMDLARDLQNCFDSERLLAFQWASGVEVLVKKLQAQDIRVGIITNGHPKIQRAKLKACRAEDLFNVILVGGEEPKEKPHKEIFLKACLLAGCHPEEAIMVGDNLKTDIQGGLNAKFLATVWVDVHLQGHANRGPKPHHIVQNIVQLYEVLRQYGVTM